MRTIVSYTILSILSVLYLFFSIRYTIVLSKSKIFTGRIRKFHFIMIWLVPFVWGWFLENLEKTSPGSHEVETKEDAKTFSDTYMYGE